MRMEVYCDFEVFMIAAEHLEPVKENRKSVAVSSDEDYKNYHSNSELENSDSDSQLENKVVRGATPARRRSEASSSNSQSTPSEVADSRLFPCRDSSPSSTETGDSLMLLVDWIREAAGIGDMHDVLAQRSQKH